MAFYVYIVASGRNGTIYTGSTDDLGKRVWEHRGKAREGFSKSYGCNRLVWYETFSSREEAFRRERRIKEWRRSWKLLLIEEDNPTWRDLYDTLHGEPDPDGALHLGPGIRRDERILEGRFNRHSLTAVVILGLVPRIQSRLVDGSAAGFPARGRE